MSLYGLWEHIWAFWGAKTGLEGVIYVKKFFFSPPRGHCEIATPYTGVKIMQLRGLTPSNKSAHDSKKPICKNLHFRYSLHILESLSGINKPLGKLTISRQVVIQVYLSISPVHQLICMHISYHCCFTGRQRFVQWWSVSAGVGVCEQCLCRMLVSITLNEKLAKCFFTL